MSWTRTTRASIPWKVALAVLLSVLLGSGCDHAQITAVAPERPGAQRFRLSCKQDFKGCEIVARRQCSDYRVIERHASEEPLKAVEGGGLSRTGPPYGNPRWRGSLLVECGKPPPPLKFVQRSDAQVSGPPAPPQPQGVTGPKPSAPGPRLRPGAQLPRGVWCVPGATQACLGPGACAGAQFCVTDGSGYSPCDCGTSRAAEVVAPDTPTSDQTAAEAPASEPQAPPVPPAEATPAVPSLAPTVPESQTPTTSADEAAPPLAP